MIRIAPVALAVALSLSSSALAQQQNCGSDKDCAGNAVCERGVCVEPGTSAAPATSAAPPLVAAPPAGAAAPVSEAPVSEPPMMARRVAIKVHPLVPVAFLIVSAGLSALVGAPVLFVALPVEVEVALAPNFTIDGTLTPLYGSVGTTSGFGAILAAGARYYFFGTALDGAFVGGEVSGGAFSAVLSSGVSAPGVGFDAQIQFGYQWVFQGGFTVAVVGTWSPVSLVTSLGTTQFQTGLGFQVPLGFAF